MKQAVVYCDGSALSNGRSNARGGIGVWISDSHRLNLSESIRDDKITNQRAELLAITAALKIIRDNSDLFVENVTICTDSEYVINSLTKWATKWVHNGWKTSQKKPVINRDLIEPLFEMYKKMRVTLKHVKSHTGKSDNDSIGNSKADFLAKTAAEMV